MSGRRGAVLLEVVAAMSIFSIAALAAIELINQLSHTQQRIEADAAVLSDQDRLLTAMSFLTREELDQRLGSHPVGPYLVEVQRPESLLYRISIGDSAGPRLITLLYRRGRS